VSRGNGYARAKTFSEDCGGKPPQAKAATGGVPSAAAALG